MKENKDTLKETAAEKLEPVRNQKDEGTAAAGPGSKWQRIIVETLVYLVPSLAYLLFKCYATSPVSGDENIYFYVGRRVMEGVLPWREIFFSHPPGHLLVSVLWMAPGWFTPFSAKMASILPALISLLLVTAILRRLAIGPLITILAALLLGLSYDFLSVSTHFTGTGWSMMFMVMAIFFLAAGRGICGGVMLALAALTSFHILPAVFGIMAAYLALHRKFALKGLLAAAGVTLAVHLFCLIVFGDSYADQVFGYHLAKTPMKGSGSASITRFFFNEYHLATLGLLGSCVWIGSVFRNLKAEPLASLHSKAPSPYLLASFGALAQVAGVFYVDRVFTYYMAPMLPLFALLAGFFLQVSHTYLSQTWALRRDSRQAGIRLACIFAVLIVIAICFSLGERLERRMGYYQKQHDTSINYTWQKSEVLPEVLDSAVRGLFFTETRRIGDVDPGLTRYLWHESRTENPSPLLDEIMRFKNRPGSLFGDASTAPYFALQTGRNIALEQADTNMQLFKSRRIIMKEMLSQLEEDPPVFMILSPTRGIAWHPEFKRHVENYYRLVADVKTARSKKRLHLYQRRD